MDELLSVLQEEGYTEPTPIQSQAIPHVLKKTDLLACAQTGTGKTAAFALPILQLLANDIGKSSDKKIRVLVLTPTRELAAQIGESFKTYGKNLDIWGSVIFGGVGSQSQVTSLRRGIDVLVATPGRLLDLIEQRHVDLKQVEIFVLDEADRMLDMGFIHDVRRVIKLLPTQRQNLLFSATMPSDIVKLANDILVNPVRVEVTPVSTTAEKIDQRVYFVDGLSAKRELLKHVLADSGVSRALVFTRTKHGADKVARFLNADGISAEAIHGNKSQNNRVRALDTFKSGKTRILVATDIAARGLDIDAVTHVINFEIPNVPETYVHRIGRTARAGAEGVSYSFCDREEKDFLKDIEKLTRQKIRVIEDHPYLPGTYVAPEPKPRSDVSQAHHQRSATRSPRNATTSSGSRPQRTSQREPRREERRPEHKKVPIRNTQRPQQNSGNRNQARPAERTGSPGPQRAQAPRSHSSRPPQRGAQQNTQVNRGRPQASRSAAPVTSKATASTGTAKKKPWWKRLLIDDE